MKRNIILLIVAVFLVTGCATSTQNESIFASFTPEPTGTPFLSYTSTVTIIPSQTVTSQPPVERNYRIVSDPDYLKDCRRQYPSAPDQQIGFRDIYPGKTTADQVRENLGDPTRRDGEIWVYYDGDFGYYYISFEDNLVDWVSVGVDLIGSGDEVPLPLKNNLLHPKELLIKYGCPDLIIAMELDPPPFAEIPNYNTTFFEYHRIGIEVRFDGYPILYSDVPSNITFFEPVSLRDFLYQSGDGLLESNFSSPVFLEEAIREN